jgi:hypothetical protein
VIHWGIMISSLSTFRVQLLAQLRYETRSLKPLRLHNGVEVVLAHFHRTLLQEQPVVGFFREVRSLRC